MDCTQAPVAERVRQLEGAVARGDRKTVQQMMLRGDLVGRGASLKLAAERGNSAILEVLLGAGWPLNEMCRCGGLDRTGSLALHEAVRTGRLAVARRLIHAGAEPNGLRLNGGVCEGALHAAVAAGQGEMVALLVRSGADVTLRAPVEPMRVAIRAGDRSIIELLREAGAPLPWGAWREAPSHELQERLRKAERK